MKILVIEDEASIRDTLKDMLEIGGHEVVTAADGQQGLERLTENPELILCDLNMPRLDGFGVLAEIRRRPETQHLPFVVLTARTDRSDQRQAMECGADDFVTKPFTMGEVLAAIDARVTRTRPLIERLEKYQVLHQNESSAPWAHEMLTPLTGILGGAELLLEEAGSLRSKELQELGELIRTCARRAESMAKKLLCHFSLEGIALGKVEMARGECDAAAVIHQVARDQAEMVGRSSDLGIAVQPGSVALSSSWFSQAVEELVENAFKFSPPGSVVLLNGSRVPSGYCLEVSDQGRGMTREQMRSIGPFRQFEREKREQQGMGLGLDNARRIAELHGGTLVIVPGLAGMGLRAILTVPSEPDQGGPASEAQATSRAVTQVH
jgi:DNA-binding response OmpR family regulator/anti-sigma regulatory factor (Ser/Thr protein kinase)